jgi:hypothetical protein
MDNSARFTNGDWKLPAHARGVHRPPEQTRIPGGERGHIAGNFTTIVLVDPKNPEKGWALK